MQTAIDHGLNPSQVQRTEFIVSQPAPKADLNWENSIAN